MRKFLVGLFLLVVSVTVVNAGGLLTNTSQSILYLRNPARNASLEIDGVYFNPAGLVFLTKGFHFSLNIQNVFQTRTIISEFTPFERYQNNGNKRKEFVGKTSAPFVPSFQGAYVTDKWVLSGQISLIGGGGKATFNDGLGSLESQVALIPLMLQQNGFPDANQYDVDSYIEGQQFIFGGQLGFTYKINENWSVYGGVRANYVANSYTGYIRDIKSNLNGGNQMMSVTDYFKTASKQAEAAAAQYKAAGDDINAAKYLAIAAKTQGVANQTADKELECDQTGWGITPIIGVNFKTNKFNFAAKYEFNTNLNIENKTKKDDTGLYKDGVNTPNDIPAILSLGVSYDLTSRWHLSAGYNHYFDSSASMADNRQDYLTHGENEYLFGVAYDVNEWLQLSGGFHFTDYGLADGYMKDMSFVTDSHSIGFGAGIKLAPKMRLNVAYYFTNYKNYEKNQTNYAGTGMSYAEDFTRTNKVFGVGFDFSF